MNEKLSEKEIKIAIKNIKRYEKNAKSWIWGRWMFLLFSLIFIGMSLFLLVKAQKIERMNTSEYLLQDGEIMLDKLSPYIDTRILLANTTSALYLKTFFCAFMGGTLIGITLGFWRKDEHNMLIAKGLRTLVALSSDDENI